MRHILGLTSLFLILNFNQSFSQGEAALPFLYVTPSPQGTGLGWTGVSTPNNDAFGFYYNPAMIGYFGQNNNLSLQTYPGSINWLGMDYINIKSSGISAGYNFKNELNGINLSIGAGYISNRISFGNFNNGNSSFESFDKYNAFSFGVALDYYITLSVGITFKDIHSVLSDLPISSINEKAQLDANAIDYGFLLSLPVLHLFDNTSIQFSDSKLIPSFNYTLGYSRSNIGDEIYYIDPAQSDPLPLTARLGQTISFGLNYDTDDLNINMLNYDLILEADDILVSREYSTDITQMNNKINYQGLFGDIDFFDNLVKLKGNDKVVIHKGHSIKIAETITILKGSFAGRGYDRVVKTNGLIVSSLGFTKWLSAISGNDVLGYISNHVELKYISSTIFDKEGFETDLSGLSVSFFNFTL